MKPWVERRIETADAMIDILDEAYTFPDQETWNAFRDVLIEMLKRLPTALKRDPE